MLTLSWYLSSNGPTSARPHATSVRRSMLSAPAAAGRFRGGALPWRLRPRSCLVSPPLLEAEKGRPLLFERYRDGAPRGFFTSEFSIPRVLSCKQMSSLHFESWMIRGKSCQMYHFLANVFYRYMLDDNSKLLVRLEKHEALVNTVEDKNPNPLLPRAIRDFVLPAGFPESVSDDYLDYMLLQLPTNVTGWICHVLVTSSLLKAVGVGSFTGISAAASAAAIRWVSKDGIGASGRLLIGGRFGTLFDDDPNNWRMYVDFIGSAGSIFELITPLYPGYFLPLASLGNLAKAVGRGFRDPSFHVIQNHFAKSENLGEIAAKEEVWEVGAQLLGLSIGVLVMDTTGVKSSYETLILTWLSVCLLHLWFRYQSLTVLKFRTINLKRGRILVRSHVAQHTVPGYVACNEEENILTWEGFMHPRISFGVTMERMLGGEESSDMVNRLLKLYRNEKYILFVEQFGLREPTFLVVFKESATSMYVLRSLWQAHWLHKNLLRRNEVFSWLEESLDALEHGFKTSSCKWRELDGIRTKSF